MELNTDPAAAFDYLDDPHHLSAHMGKSSMMMAGSRMDIRLDDKAGKGLGAEIILEGAMMGIPLYVRETVVESIPTKKKVWETQGPQKMIVIKGYKMGFELTAKDKKSVLKVFIEYDLPSSGVGKLLGPWLGHFYAKWCVRQMAKDAAHHFNRAI